MSDDCFTNEVADCSPGRGRGEVGGWGQDGRGAGGGMRWEGEGAQRSSLRGTGSEKVVMAREENGRKVTPHQVPSHP